MMVVERQNAYQGAYAERTKNWQAIHAVTKEQKEVSVERVKTAIGETRPPYAGKFDSLSVSEEAKEFTKYTRVYQDDKIAGSNNPFWKNTGSQYLVFSEKLYHSGFFDSMSDKQVGEMEEVLSTITQGMDSLSNAQYMTGQGPSGGSGGYTLPTSYEARMELESSTAVLKFFGEKFIEDEGLRREFEGLVDDYYAHNTEVLDEYVNPVEQMDKAVSRFRHSPGNSLYQDLFARTEGRNAHEAAYSRYMGSITHTEEEEQQYGKDLAYVFEQLRHNPSHQSGIWKQLQDTMLNYATKNGGTQNIRNQVLVNAGDSLSRIENSWSCLYNFT